jgi:RNA polymerase sigma factor (sigma-70 family)
MANTALGSLLHSLRRLHDRAAAEATDGELLRRHVGGDKAAFAALVRRHAPMVWGVCRRLLDNDQDAEDAFQAAFVVLLRKAESLRVPQSVAAFLHGVAARIARKAQVTGQRRRRHEAQAEMPRSSDPFVVVEQRELRALLDEELDRLPEKYRAPLVLCYLEGLSYTEAARQLRWRDGTVCGRLARARQLLRQRLNRRGLTLSGAALAAALTESSSAPAASVAAVARMAALFALGQTAAGAVSPPVAALAQGTLQAMTAAKLKTLAVLVVVLGLFAAGAGVTASHFLAMKPPETDKAVNAPPDKPTTEKSERTDLYGDPLPPGALLRMGTVRFRHPNLIGNAAFSPNGKLLAAAANKGVILFYEAATGRKIRQLQTKATNIPAFAFAPDGKTLASAGPKTIQIWDTEIGKELRRFDAETSPFWGQSFPFVFSGDGKMLASVAPNNAVCVWEVKTGKALAKMRGHQYSVHSLVFSPDGRVLYSADGEGLSTRDSSSVRAWDVAAGKQIKTFSLDSSETIGAYVPLCFSSDGKTLAFAARVPPDRMKVKGAAREQVVCFLDLASGEVRRSRPDHQERFQSAAFSRDGKIFAAMHSSPLEDGSNSVLMHGDHRVKVWDTTTGKQLFDFPAYDTHDGIIRPYRLAFAPNGKQLAAASFRCVVQVWDLAPNRASCVAPEAHEDQVQCVTFSPDGRTLATGGSDRTLAVWDSATGRQRWRQRRPEGQISSLAFSPVGKWIASASLHPLPAVQLWDAAASKELHNFEVPGVPAGDGGTTWSVSAWVAFTANGKQLAAAGTDRKLRLWDPATGKELRNQTVRGLQRPANVKPIEFFTIPPYKVEKIVFAADGHIMALLAGKTVSVVDVAAGQLLFQHEKKPPGFNSVLALSPDGKTLLCGAGKSLRIVESASGVDLLQLTLPADVYAAAFSADGRRFAVSTSEAGATIHVFDVPSGQETSRLHGHESLARSLAFSPNGSKLASGQEDSTALVWDVSTARRELPSRNLTAKDLGHLWTALKEAGAPKAHAALWTLVAAPDKAVPFLKEHLRPAPRVAAERLHRMIADLDAEEFARRDASSRAVAKLGIEAESALRKALEGKPSLEVRRRVEALLTEMKCQTEMTPDTLQQLRAIQVLEQIGSPQARQILAALAQGAPAAPATRDAAAALARLERQASRP